MTLPRRDPPVTKYARVEVKGPCGTATVRDATLTPLADGLVLVEGHTVSSLGLSQVFHWYEVRRREDIVRIFPDWPILSQRPPTWWERLCGQRTDVLTLAKEHHLPPEPYRAAHAPAHLCAHPYPEDTP